MTTLFNREYYLNFTNCIPSLGILRYEFTIFEMIFFSIFPWQIINGIWHMYIFLQPKARSDTHQLSQPTVSTSLIYCTDTNSNSDKEYINIRVLGCFARSRDRRSIVTLRVLDFPARTRLEGLSSHWWVSVARLAHVGTIYRHIDAWNSWCGFPCRATEDIFKFVTRIFALMASWKSYIAVSWQHLEHEKVCKLLAEQTCYTGNIGLCIYMCNMCACFISMLINVACYYVETSKLKQLIFIL